MWDICIMQFIILVLNHNISLYQRSVTDALGRIQQSQQWACSTSRARKRSGSPNVFFNRLPMVRIGAVNFRGNQWLTISLRTDLSGYGFG